MLRFFPGYDWKVALWLVLWRLPGISRQVFEDPEVKNNVMNSRSRKKLNTAGFGRGETGSSTDPLSSWETVVAQGSRQRTGWTRAQSLGGWRGWGRTSPGRHQCLRLRRQRVLPTSERTKDVRAAAVGSVFLLTHYLHWKSPIDSSLCFP